MMFLCLFGVALASLPRSLDELQEYGKYLAYDPPADEQLEMIGSYRKATTLLPDSQWGWVDFQDCTADLGVPCGPIPDTAAAKKKRDIDPISKGVLGGMKGKRPPLPTRQDVQDSKGKPFRETYYWKYLTPIIGSFVVSIVLAVLTILACLTFCVARGCCGCCGGKKPTKGTNVLGCNGLRDGYTDEESHGILKVILVFSIILWLGGVFDLMGNTEVAYANKVLTGTALGAMDESRGFAQKLVDQVDKIGTGLEDTKPDINTIFNTVENIGGDVYNAVVAPILDLLDGITILSDLILFANTQIDYMEASFTATQVLVDNLHTEVDRLDTETQSLKTADVNGTTVDMDVLGILPPSSAFQSNYPNFSNQPDLNSLRDDINKTGHDLSSVTVDINNQLSNMSATIDDKVANITQDLRVQAFDAIDGVVNKISNTTAKIAPKLNQINESRPTVDKYVHKADSYVHTWRALHMTFVFLMWVAAILGCAGIHLKNSSLLTCSWVFLMLFVALSWLFIALHLPISEFLYDVCEPNVDAKIWQNVDYQILSSSEAATNPHQSNTTYKFNKIDGIVGVRNCIAQINMVDTLKYLDVQVDGYGVDALDNPSQILDDKLPYVDIVDKFNLQDIFNFGNTDIADRLNNVYLNNLTTFSFNDFNFTTSFDFNLTAIQLAVDVYNQALITPGPSVDPQLLPDYHLAIINGITSPTVFVRQNISSLNVNGYGPANVAQLTTEKDATITAISFENTLALTIIEYQLRADNVSRDLGNLQSNFVTPLELRLNELYANISIISQQVDVVNQYAKNLSLLATSVNTTFIDSINQTLNALQTELRTEVSNLVDNFASTALDLRSVGDCKLVSHVYYGVTGGICSYFMPGVAVVWFGKLLEIIAMLVLVCCFIIMAKRVKYPPGWNGENDYEPTGFVPKRRDAPIAMENLYVAPAEDYIVVTPQPARPYVPHDDLDTSILPRKQEPEYVPPPAVQQVPIKAPTPPPAAPPAPVSTYDYDANALRFEADVDAPPPPPPPPM
eukprot:TRINITY_DN476_c1_g1_i1.p1 TRINITY_DN476_c1_g1~~TRINITY_DN476_c1_g1_i1.p1  ORF type:complete len:1029 (+),score=249.66 TRINITY_DN476_c1_g1_i1:30-3089(+)